MYDPDTIISDVPITLVTGTTLAKDFVNVLLNKIIPMGMNNMVVPMPRA